jgi:hypothetical protein
MKQVRLTSDISLIIDLGCLLFGRGTVSCVSKVHAALIIRGEGEGNECSSIGMKDLGGGVPIANQ